MTYTNCLFLFFFYSSVDHRYLHSFPTRRSSDLVAAAPRRPRREPTHVLAQGIGARDGAKLREYIDRKSTRLNSSHGYISYAVFCLKKKKKNRKKINKIKNNNKRI